MTLRQGAIAGLIAGLALGLTGAAIRFAGVSLPPELVADRVLPLLPVQLFIKVVGLMGGPLAAKQKALVGGFLGAPLGGALLGAFYAWLLRKPFPGRHPPLTLGMAMLVTWLGALLALWPVLDANYLGLPPDQARLATAAGLLLQFAVYVVVLGVVVEMRAAHPRPASEVESRRTFVIGGAAVLMAVLTGGLGTALYRASTLLYDGMELPPPVDRITPPDKFYVVTKNLIDPTVNRSLWRLEVTGRVAKPAMYDLDQLLAMPGLVDQETTLECISNEVGRGLMSNAVWRGLRLRDLVDASQPQPDAVGISFYGADGYKHTAALEKAMRDTTVVAFMMNGRPLPERHGYPARLLFPSAYGEVSVKWLNQIDVVNHEEKGYYESQGWQPTYVQTTARIEVPAAGAVLAAGRPMQMRGTAYAADRGISAVEVSLDSGASWIRAQTDSGTPNTWYFWTLPWVPAGSGARRLMVRTYDGGGVLQKQTYQPSVPAGVSGVFTIEVTVR